MFGRVYFIMVLIALLLFRRHLASLFKKKTVDVPSYTLINVSRGHHVFSVHQIKFLHGRTGGGMTKLASVRKQQSAAQTTAKKHLKTHLKRIRNREYSRLRDMVPAIANKQKVSKVTVIEEAVRYIDELHRALASRLVNSEISNLTSDQDVIKDIVHSFIPADFYDRRKQVQNDFESQEKLHQFMEPIRTSIPHRFL